MGLDTPDRYIDAIADRILRPAFDTAREKLTSGRAPSLLIRTPYGIDELPAGICERREAIVMSDDEALRGLEMHVSGVDQRRSLSLALQKVFGEAKEVPDNAAEQNLCIVEVLLPEDRDCQLRKPSMCVSRIASPRRHYTALLEFYRYAVSEPDRVPLQHYDEDRKVADHFAAFHRRSGHNFTTDWCAVSLQRRRVTHEQEIHEQLGYLEKIVSMHPDRSQVFWHPERTVAADEIIGQNLPRRWLNAPIFGTDTVSPTGRYFLARIPSPIEPVLGDLTKRTADEARRVL